MLLTKDMPIISLATQKTRGIATHVLVGLLLRVFAAQFNLRPSLKKQLKSDSGWINFSVGIRTKNNLVKVVVIFQNGRVRVTGKKNQKPDVWIISNSPGSIIKLLGATPTQQIQMLLQSEMRTEGNLSYLNLFTYYLSLLVFKKQKKNMGLEKIERAKTLEPQAPVKEQPGVKAKPLSAPTIDESVKYLEDPYLSIYELKNFPRIEKFLNLHFTTTPEICPELPRLVTDWHKLNGFDKDINGKDWVPVLRKAHAFKYLMENKKPFIRKHDLLAGTTTTKDIGVVVYPEGHGTMIWGELLTVPHRMLNPYGVSEKTRNILHHEVFPFWAKKNFREWVRKKYDNPLCQRIDERFAVYFDWKSVTISHTIPDFPKLLSMGATGIIKEINEQLKNTNADQEKKDSLIAMALCLEGLIAYARHLSEHATKQAELESDPARKAELKKLARICARAPKLPAKTLDEAINAIWIAWVAIHMENTNAGMSLGRLDLWLQPYFEADMAKYKTKKKREQYIRHAIELVGCLFMRCTDHLPLTPDLANYYFGGSSSDQAITLGGVTPDGKDAVCDMTYIFLKVTQMLSIRDPNVNARFCPGINSQTYLKRLCEVNLITRATPSIHNDHAVKASLAEFSTDDKDLNDWSATGCVEPTISGKHMGHTGCLMMNMVAALEMALNNGWHPLMNWKLGPDTGSVENKDFPEFEDFFTAFTSQFAFLIDQSIEFNEMLGTAHQKLRPTPLLSSLITGCIESGRDVTRGGARYNSTGVACIGLADITDSLMAIKTLVYEEKRLSLRELKRAVQENFVNSSALLARIRNKVSLFGSGSDEAVAMANRVTKFTHDYYAKHINYRGGPYSTGFWSMSNHVSFGVLTGALPSGRLSGKPFTPGLTPEANASKSLLDNLRDVARLDPKNMSNNIAFNVKVVPASHDTRKQIVNNMYSYVRSYFDLGGMQMQLNVVDSNTLKDAMAHPENYRNLLVRISGYNAYFTTLNHNMQMELIQRAEYGI